jgi:hypothetical protein
MLSSRAGLAGSSAHPMEAVVGHPSERGDGDQGVVEGRGAVEGRAPGAVFGRRARTFAESDEPGGSRDKWDAPHPNRPPGDPPSPAGILAGHPQPQVPDRRCGGWSAWSSSSPIQCQDDCRPSSRDAHDKHTSGSFGRVRIGCLDQTPSGRGQGPGRSAPSRSRSLGACPSRRAFDSLRVRPPITSLMFCVLAAEAHRGSRSRLPLTVRSLKCG